MGGLYHSLNDVAVKLRTKLRLCWGMGREKACILRKDG